VGCLRNGRGQAAEFLASRGARLDLEGAAGVGRLDTLQSFFDNDGSLKPPATERQLKDGFAWACQFGKTSAVEFLLQKGIKVDAKLAYGAETGLHWAGFSGHADTVKLLLEHRPPIEAKDERHDGTPLQWALYAWGTSSKGAELERYYEAVALLIRAGAKLDPQWFENDEGRFHTATKMRSDPSMQAALRGEMPE
jgi:Ankyrin repeats (3 copies)